MNRFFITDDNFARNKNWEAIFDRIIELREREGLNTNFMIQVDTLCHKIPNFIEKAARAGCKQVFIGLENINPDNLKSAKQGAEQDHRVPHDAAGLARRRASSPTRATSSGFPATRRRPSSATSEIIQRELPVDMLEFFILTPLPGSEDHKELYDEGVWMDPDMNKYDLEHVTAPHPKMSPRSWQAIYDQAWDIYYSGEHIETLFRRAACAPKVKSIKLVAMILWFYGAMRYERVHPLQAGAWRVKQRTQRRRGMPIESPLVFYPRRAVGDPAHLRAVAALVPQASEDARGNRQRSGHRSYMDIAITPASEAGDRHLDMYESTASARAAVAKASATQRRIDKARGRIPLEVA